VTIPLIEHLVSVLLSGKTTTQRTHHAPLVALASKPPGELY